MTDPDDKREAALDETIDESFPASDPPANTVETGVAGSPQDATASDTKVCDNRAESRFELKKNGQLAFLLYDRTPNSVVLVHTEVPESLRGHHIGEALVTAAIAAVRTEGLRIIPQCSYVRSYLSKHPEIAY